MSAEVSTHERTVGCQKHLDANRRGVTASTTSFDVVQPATDIYRRYKLNLFGRYRPDGHFCRKKRREKNGRFHLGNGGKFTIRISYLIVCGSACGRSRALLSAKDIYHRSGEKRIFIRYLVDIRLWIRKRSNFVVLQFGNFN